MEPEGTRRPWRVTYWVTLPVLLAGEIAERYLFFRADPVETSIDNDSIDLEIRIYEGPQATIDRVVINGNDRTNEHVIRRVIIRGRVQGVGYRDWTRYVARERGVEVQFQTTVTGLERAVLPIGDWSTLITLSKCSMPSMAS